MEDVGALVLTNHARQRIAERFPDRDIGAEWVFAKKATKRERRLIAKSCENHRHVSRKSCTRYKYMVSPSGIVFVVRDGVVITVLPMPVQLYKFVGPKDRKKKYVKPKPKENIHRGQDYARANKIIE